MVKFNMQNTKPLLEWFLGFTSITVIVFYLYWRINRKQYQIALIPEEIDKYFWVFMYFFLTSCFMLILLCFSFYIKRRKVNTEKQNLGFFVKFFLNLSQKISLWNIFYKTYSLLFHSISTDYMQYPVTYANRIMDYSDFKNNVIMLIFVVMPRAFIVFTFIFEIYLRSLHYYFFSLFLLFIPLIFRFLLFIYSDISTQVLPKLEELVEKVPDKVTVTLNGEKKIFRGIGIRFKLLEGDDPKVTYDLDYFMFNFYNPMLFIGPHMEVNILPLYYKYVNVTLWVYNTIHLLGWGYILFIA